MEVLAAPAAAAEQAPEPLVARLPAAATEPPEVTEAYEGLSHDRAFEPETLAVQLAAVQMSEDTKHGQALAPEALAMQTPAAANDIGGAGGCRSRGRCGGVCSACEAGPGP